MNDRTELRLVMAAAKCVGALEGLLASTPDIAEHTREIAQRAVDEYTEAIRARRAELLSAREIEAQQAVLRG
jgi:hypothetical protein